MRKVALCYAQQSYAGPYVRFDLPTCTLGIASTSPLLLQDDWIGITDAPNKDRGNLVNGAFTLLSSPSQASNALLITSNNDAVLFHSAKPGVAMVYNSCCAFFNA